MVAVVIQALGRKGHIPTFLYKFQRGGGVTSVRLICCN
jgi:hypothetical protein